MARIKFLSLIKPFMVLVPEVVKPAQKIQIRTRVWWTGAVLFIYLVCSQIPVYGIQSNDQSDPFYWMRALIASNRGTLMELGISPIVTSSLVLQLLSGAKIIDVDKGDKEDKALYQGAQKLLGMIITLVEAMLYVLFGMYGDVSDLGVGNAILIIFQLFVAGIVVIVLDEFLSKDYGLGSGISLFIATNICENIIWRSFAPTSHNSGRGTEFEGALIALVHLLVTKPSKIQALREAFYRPHLPNVTNLLSTVLIFLLVVWLQGFNVPVRTTNERSGGASQPYQIKLFYTSNIPIILQTALVSNLYFISQMLYKKLPTNLLVQLLGVWEVPPGGDTQNMRPVRGLAWFVTPPTSLTDILENPTHAIVYLFFVLLVCTKFSRTWIDVSGTSSKDVAQQLKDQRVSIQGHRAHTNQMQKYLDNYIPIAASLGGLCIGVLSVVADLMGAIGSGTGILLAVTTIYQYYEIVKKESGAEGAGSILKG